ncbi:hypothetical protein VNDN146_03140 [Mycobacterium tuberculosis]|nr:hypothetical protein VNDN146_03140 [Mycobacterium tuberculosis]
MDFVVSAPEVNSLRMYLGAGSGPMLAAAAAWDGLADELAVAASWFGSVTSGLADAAWRGPRGGCDGARGSPLPGLVDFGNGPG